MTAIQHRSTIMARLQEATWQLGPQGQWLAHLISHETAPGCHSSLRAVLMPPGHVSGAHLHRHHEVQIFVVKGIAATLLGSSLEPIVHGVGDPICVPPGEIHGAVNLSDTDWLLAIETFSDPRSKDVELLPHLDVDVESVAARLRSELVADIAHFGRVTIDDLVTELAANVTAAADGDLR